MRNGKILLAEDEGCVAQATSRLLHHLGFEVVIAEDGRQAVEQFLAASHEFDLAILDLTMPRLDGIEAQMQIREICPELKIILTSGHDEETAHQASFGDVPYLRKPYRLADLKSALQSVLGSECLD